MAHFTDRTPHQRVRDGRNAARQLSSLTASQCLSERDADRLLAKVADGFAAADELMPPEPASDDFPETLARLRRVAAMSDAGITRSRYVGHLLVLDGDRQ